MSNRAALYIVATPIGNLEDLSPRAARLLGEVALVAAEDTRTTRKLLSHFGIATPTTALHEHNEREQVPKLVERLRLGESIALVSDAGTPLVSDPGFHLVRAAHAAGIAVVPVPGPCAAITALSAAGLPSDRFAFEGFPPARVAARRTWLQRVAQDPRTLIFYESPHRIVESLADMAAVFGGDREALVARELTKKFETLHLAPLDVLAGWIARPETPRQGEFVIVVHGAPARTAEADAASAVRVLTVLLEALPVSQAVELAAKITGVARNTLYRQALVRRGE